MVERANFYNAVDVEGVSTSSGFTRTMDSGTDPARILGSALTANTKYLLLARAMFGCASAGNTVRIRANTDDDGEIGDKASHRIEFQQTASGAKMSYLFAHSYIALASPADVEMQLYGSASFNTLIDQSTLWLLDLDEISAPNLLATAYFDASDAGPTDDGLDWINEANAFDGTLTTFANTNTAGGGIMHAEGTTAPTSGATIGAVEVRVLMTVPENLTLDIDIEEDSVGGTTLGVITTTSAQFILGKAWRSVLLTAPAGGWTWQKVNDLAIQFDPGTLATDVEVYIAEVRVYDENGLGYHEDIQPQTGDEYDLALATTVLARLNGSDLGTDEHVIFGCASVGIGSTGRWYDHALYAAYDSSAPDVVSRHRAEGEDTSETRLTGFAVRHKASSGSPSVSIYGQEEAANANAEDFGAYLIGLPASLFADFVHDYEAAFLSIDGTEKTIATVGPYTPSVTGNHLIIGRANGSNQPNGLGQLWVESTGTAIRTGDEDPTHNQIWDSTKDDEQMVTLQRYSMTTAETLNLRNQSVGSPFAIEHRWLLVLNLNAPAGAAVDFIPRRRQRATVRM